MNGGKQQRGRATQARSWALAFCAAAICFLGGVDFASAQITNAPPLDPPKLRSLPDGKDTLALGVWLLYPTLSLSSFYDSNLYSASAPPIIKTTGIEIRPSLLADYDTGIYKTSIYGSIDSSIYPFIDSQNDTFNRQAGFTEKYEAMRDLVFTVQGNYSHATNASVSIQSIPGPIISPATPLLPGSAGVTASQQTVVNPNDTLTATGTIYKEFNRAFVSMTGTVLHTSYANTQTSPDYSTGLYTGSGATWLTPWLYAFANGSQAFSIPVGGPDSNSFRAVSGLATPQIGLFSGGFYYGRQGTQVDGDGSAGGIVYGGMFSYFPTAVWHASVSLDHTTNISNITGTLPNNPGLSVPLSPVGIPTTSSVLVSALTFRSDYKWSAQTSLYGLVSYTRTGYIGETRVDNGWTASAGIRRSLTQRLILSLDYLYSSVVSTQPGNTFIKNRVTLGATYNF